MKIPAMGKAKSDAPKTSIGMLLLKGRTFIALVILIIFFSFASSSFLNPESLLLICKHVLYMAFSVSA
jgi:ribose/xylose/arabinose/galactoside ABC-type transport system permease subunit